MKRLVHLGLLLTSAALPALLGCSQMAVRGKPVASAPAIGEEGQAHIRGVSDPNAPFTLIDRTRSSALRPFTGEENSSPACEPSQLQVFETGASMQGDQRVLRLAVKNRGPAACRLSGRPAIQLLNQSGELVAGIAIRQSGPSTLAARVEALPVREAAAQSEQIQPAATPSVETSSINIVLRPSAEAAFEIGWSSSANCPVVSRFTVALPPAADESNDHATKPAPATFTINHPLTVCNGEVSVSSLIAGGLV